ncbi:MAG: hypothetical protein WDN69_10670 [Aliidongia sp.]
MRTRTEGVAEADRIAAVGEAGARATKAQVEAFGGPRLPAGQGDRHRP